MYPPNPHRQQIPAARRDRFASVGLETASRGKILVLCFDRLDRDLVEARDAIAAGDHFTTNIALGHAQELLGELALMIDPTAWEHAGALLAVYDYVLRLLTNANMQKSDAIVVEAQRILAEIGEAFRVAAASDPDPTAATAAPEGEADPAPTSHERFSVQA